MGKQAVSRNNSRYRSDKGSIRDRAYEICVGSYKRIYITVPVEDMKYLGLMPDWGETAYLSEGVRRSWAGGYVYLEGEDKDLFCSMYERVFGHAPITHEKANGTRGQITRLPMLSEPLPTDDEIYDIPIVEYSNDATVPAGTTDVAVYNPILQSVTDFVMYMMVFHLISGHGTQGPRLLNTKLKMLRQWVRAKTPVLSGSFYDDKTRMMWVYMFRTRFPVCPTCGKEFGRLKNIHLSGTYCDYQPHCSSRCAALDPCARAKLEASSLSKYGVSRPASATVVRDKIKRTSIDKYGVENPFSSSEVRAKIEKTCIDRFGVPHPLQSKAIYDKTVDSVMERYGVTNSLFVPGVREKVKETMIKRYGVDSPLKNSAVKAKAKRTLMEHYGVDSPTRSPEFLNKAIETRIRNQRLVNKPKEDGLVFDSKWELAFYRFCKSLKLDVEYHPCSIEYEYKGVTHRYYPDFRVGQKLYEVKGDCFIKPDGSWKCPFRRKGVTDDEYADECGLLEAKHGCVVEHGVVVVSRSEMKDLGRILNG